MPTAVVKLGSSVVAEPSGDLRPGVLDRICDEVAALHGTGIDVVVVTSGAIARGMRLLELAVRPRAIEDLQAASAVGQGKLYRVYDELLRDRGLTSAQVAVLVGAELLVLLTDTGGLYTADPRTDPSARLVEEISELEALSALDIGAATSPLGSGGMRSKVVAAEMATAAGIGTVIASGLEPGAIVRAWAREPVGTRFTPGPARHSSFKLWLKYAKPSHGTLCVDAGAARALREGGTSLLPVGIVAVEGAFDAGDAVEIREAGDAPIGKGICNYSAAELRRVMGRKSAQVREVLPRATEEAVHRDYFVLA